jgi:hypothetical protein
MKVMDDLRKETINQVVENVVSKQNHLYTDDSTSYVDLHGFVE